MYAVDSGGEGGSQACQGWIEGEGEYPEGRSTRRSSDMCGSWERALVRLTREKCPPLDRNDGSGCSRPFSWL